PQRLDVAVLVDQLPLLGDGREEALRRGGGGQHPPQRPAVFGGGPGGDAPRGGGERGRGGSGGGHAGGGDRAGGGGLGAGVAAGEGLDAGLHAGDEGGLARGYEDVELLTEAGVVADDVEQVALGLGERLQGDGLAGAAEERLDQVEADVRDAGRRVAGQAPDG